jgi:hypothetical protein
MASESLEVVRIHEFADDDEAHDDAAHGRLVDEFTQAFSKFRTELTESYGPPREESDADANVAPLCGVFCAATWPVGNLILYLAAAHEDRECPYLLALGTRAVGPEY